MNKFLISKILFTSSIILLISCKDINIPNRDEVKILPPEELYGQLFYDIQSNEKIFSDSKTFVDCVPKFNIKEILDNYSKIESKSDSIVLISFIKENFIIPEYQYNFKSDSSSINEHITKLWDLLKRPADKRITGTLIPLNYSYIIPGGRFREIYYWDSYFTMLGLQADNKVEIIQHMIDNFSDLIDSIGFIPNGNRTYYLSRSQPPFYAMMIHILAELKGETIYKDYLKYLEKEYAFWMNGSEKLDSLNNSFRRVVKLRDGEILNRYWDDKNTARSEMYREDIKTANEAKLNLPNCKQENVFRNLRAAAESGWDFSSRWLSANNENIYKLYTIHTTEIVPVDLNALLYNLEYTISKAYEISNDKEKADEYKKKYELRKKAIMKYCWNKESGFFMDYNFKQNKQTDIYSLAGVYPLFFNIADKEQSVLVAKKIQKSFLKAGGVVTTLNKTHQQWDSPNGWSPLQWITIKGLRNYGHNSLANEIKERWLSMNQKVYNSTFKMLEKYNVEDLSLDGGGGEYPNQDGFGWTNGVYQNLSKE